MSDTDIFTFLVDETLKLHQSGGLDLSRLELKLQDYSLSYLRGEFIPQIQMLRFNLKGQIMDVPINWDIFNPEVTTLHQILSIDIDRDHLFDVLKSVWLKELRKLLIIHSDGFSYIVGLTAAQEVHLHDLLNPQECLRAA
jgi:hypothetical protein